MVLPIFSELASYVVSKLKTRVRRTGKERFNWCVYSNWVPIASIYSVLGSSGKLANGKKFEASDPLPYLKCGRSK